MEKSYQELKPNICIGNSSFQFWGLAGKAVDEACVLPTFLRERQSSELESARS